MQHEIRLLTLNRSHGPEVRGYGVCLAVLTHQLVAEGYPEEACQVPVTGEQ